MDETKSFLEHPLDQSLYVPKKFAPEPKPPLRVLISEAGGKIAYNLIYKICSGKIFGDDQPIILHLQNSKGTLHHKTIALELVECGFPCFKDAVLSSNPAVICKNINVAIMITSFEETSGLPISGTLVHQAVKSLCLVKDIHENASKDCKIVFAGPATKTLTIMLSALSKFLPQFPPENISCVTCLDSNISKAVLGKKLRTTTDRIKNVVIWSNTYPDISKATVRMYPPDDLSLLEMKEIPVADAIQDDQWLCQTFGAAIYRRVTDPDLMAYGKAVAAATAQHLKVLLTGSKNSDEIHSMGVLTPSTEPYGVPVNYCFSFPVIIENEKWKVMQDIKVAVPTQINIMNTCNKSIECTVRNNLTKAVQQVMSHDLCLTWTSRFILNHNVNDILKINKWDIKYFVTSNPSENIEKPLKREGHLSRKSIVWDEAVFPTKKLKHAQKSLIRFSFDSLKGNKKDSKEAMMASFDIN